LNFSHIAFREQTRPDSWECNFVLVDAAGRELDVHSYALDDAGNNIYRVQYMPEQFAGTETIGSCPVRCISPEWLVRFHSEYELDENDYHDLRLQGERFGIPLPDEYKQFLSRKGARPTVVSDHEKT
jgi:lincosamide nucleotidyltransferase A/C/D/E